MRSYKIKEQKEAGMLIRMLIESFPSEKTTLHIAIPGGRSILSILDAFKEVGKATLQKCRFYLVDERVKVEMNQDTVRKAFFDRAVKEGIVHEEQLIFPAFTDDIEQDMQMYEEKLPEKFDLLIFGVGEDGHIASLFPLSKQLEAERKLFHVTDAPKPPAERITLTFAAFNEDATVVLLFMGDGKQDALKNAMEEDVEHCPAAYFRASENTHLITDNELP